MSKEQNLEPPSDWMYHSIECAHRRIGPTRADCDCGHTTLEDRLIRAVNRMDYDCRCGNLKPDEVRAVIREVCRGEG